MLTYTFNPDSGPLYEQLYNRIREDIQSGRLASKEKMPSKRAFARNLGVSTITIENAYDQLISEGYLTSLPRQGYFVSDLAEMQKVQAPVRQAAPAAGRIRMPEPGPEIKFDFSSNKTDPDTFPFSVWAKIMRETIAGRRQILLEASPAGGARTLREAIAGHLASFRGMTVDPDQIIIGAGTEYLYGLLIQLLGRKKVYCIENPGYKKLKSIYESEGAVCRTASLDEKGLRVDQLRAAGADVAHISPTHHFPTGITMPVSRRYELLAWANEAAGRYIIEDDYDSEFRVKGRPIPSMQSIDAGGKVIYMNTFSKSLTSAIRISYMVLPEELADRFYRDLAFYSCTVSTFDQYVLAEFIRGGHFERHINRMRLFYGRRRSLVLAEIREAFGQEECWIIENDSGLHLILELATGRRDREIQRDLLDQGIRLLAIGDYDMSDSHPDRHQFILNYSGLDMDRLDGALAALRSLL